MCVCMCVLNGQRLLKSVIPSAGECRWDRDFQVVLMGLWADNDISGNTVAIGMYLLEMFKLFDPAIQSLRIYAGCILNDVNMGV